tara:strand:- start:183 stop:956 length:774 start_codon:yes stop_codon:yes gene_type:complete
MKHKSIKGLKHLVFDDLDEYYSHFGKQAKPPVENWKEGKELDWVIADDGGIIQLLKVSHNIKHPNDRPNYKLSKGWCRTVVGTFLIKKNTYMDTDFEKHPNRYTFSTKIKNTNSRVYKRQKATRKEKEFATHIVTGKSAVKAYMESFKEASEDKATKKAAVLLKQRRVMSEIEASALEVAKELGIDHRYILRTLKCLAENSGDDNIQLQAIKELGKAVGTLGQTKKVETGVVGLFQGFSQDQLEGASRPVLTEKTEV